MEEKKKKQTGAALGTAAMGAVAGVTGTLGVEGIAANIQNREEEETEETAQTTSGNSINSNHEDPDIQDDIIDSGSSSGTGGQTADVDEIQPVDSGGAVTSEAPVVAEVELPDVNPYEVAQEIVIDEDDSSNYLASHAPANEIESEVEEFFNEDAEHGEDVALEEVNTEEEEEDPDEGEYEDDLASSDDSDESDDMGDMVDDI